jgi:gliding motility-associated-like protein
MKSNLRVLYGTTLAKYSKFKSRYDKNVRNGHFKDLSDRKKSQIISKLKRLYNRLCQLRLQLKLAAATGILALGLTATQSATAQQLGPFVQNDAKNPFFRTNITESDVKTTFGDLDFDGDLDMVMGNGAGTIRFFRNDGNAGFARFVEQTFKYNPFYGVTANNGHASPYLIDLDDDGDLDLILGARGTYGDRNVRYFENTDNEDGIFGNELIFTEITGVSNPIDEINGQYNNAHQALGDIDGDGDLDVLMGNSRGYANGSYTGEALTLFRNNGGTDFTQEDAYSNLPGIPTFFYGDNDVSPTLFDLDGDGDLDLFVGNGSFGYSGQIRFFENNDIDLPSDAVLGDNIGFTEQTGANNPFNGIDKGYNASVTFVDLDGDGDNDAVIGSSSGIDFFENNSNVFTERFGKENPFATLDFGFDPAPTTADIDGDGFLDVVIGEKYSQSLFYFLNAQNGTLTEIKGSSNPFENILGTSDDKPVPAFADIDNDGDLDLFVTIDYYQIYPLPDIARIEFFRNTGSNIFVNESSPITTNENNTVFSTSVGDFDNDSDFDALVGGYSILGSGFNLQFIENQGTPTTPVFALTDPASSPTNGFNISDNYLKPVFVDLDHDGDLDVVSGVHADSYSGQLLFFNNDSGDLNFQTGVNSPFFDSGAGVNFDFGEDSHPAFIDIDNDDDLDVLIGLNSGQITYLENQNEPPLLTTISSPLSFTENGVSIALDPTLTITDDGTDLIIEARVQVQNYVNGQDILTFTASGGIAGTFFTSGGNAGTLVLSGTASIADYQTVLRTVRYRNISDNPNVSPKNIQFSAMDFDNTDPFSDSNPEPIISITIVPVNDAPYFNSIVNGLFPVFIENGTPIDANNDLFDIFDDDDINLESATVRISNGLIASEDVLTFTDQNNITGIYDPSTATWSLTGTSTLVNYRTAIKSIRYYNTSENPNSQSRTLEVIVSDGEDFSGAFTHNFGVLPVNDAPVVSSTNTTPLDYDQNTTAVVVDDLIDIIDVDDTQLVSAAVTIAGYQTGDILAGSAPSGGSIDFDAGTGILTLSGTATLTEYISALSTVTFSSDQSGSRQLNFTVNDGTDDSNVYSRDLNIILPNEAPVISSANEGTAVDYTQNGSPLILDDQIIINDVDDTDLESLTVTIGDYLTGDTLTITEAPGTVAVFDEVAGTLTLSGTNSVAEYQTALQSLSFASTNGAGARQILIVANDGDDNSNTFTIDVNISDEIIPQPPVVNTTPATTQEGSRLTIDLCAIISDPDNTFDELTITVVSITSGAVTSIDGCDLVIDYEGLDFSGTDFIVLSATDPDGNTDQNTLSITVEEEPVVNGGDLLIYNAISPNGDGANDWWEIVNLTTPNKIELYNRWGDLVKTLNNYENIENNSQLDDLPVGTYFYKISSPQGEYTGYITIKK